MPKHTINNYLSLVKFSHTIFALPFALIGFFIAVKKFDLSFEWNLFIKVILCMVFARSAAMGFNRYIDRDIDRLNPRTSIREIPMGIISPKAALVFVIINCLLFILTTYFINTICLVLSPVALLVILGYSYTKRFTALCHLVLGIGLSLAPIGAFLAVSGFFDVLPVLFSFIVLFWVSGFDIIYALQDERFDREQQLNSIPAKVGLEQALKWSSVLHILCFVLVMFAGYWGNFGNLYWCGAFIFSGMLYYQHSLVKPNDLSKVNIAFATTNGIASVLFSVFVLLDIFL
jgi:4-hydroxybenzoate polyprenyltransferase